MNQCELSQHLGLRKVEYMLKNENVLSYNTRRMFACKKIYDFGQMVADL